MMNLIILFFFVMIYIHIYLHFKINPFNEMSQINDICKQEISNTCYYLYIANKLLTLKTSNYGLCKSILFRASHTFRSFKT